MESNHRYFSRRAVQESLAATRAMTPQARDWHRQLADDFSRKAEEQARAMQAA